VIGCRQEFQFDPGDIFVRLLLNFFFAPHHRSLKTILVGYFVGLAPYSSSLRFRFQSPLSLVRFILTWTHRLETNFWITQTISTILVWSISALADAMKILVVFRRQRRRDRQNLQCSGRRQYSVMTALEKLTLERTTPPHWPCDFIRGIEHDEG